MSAAESNTDDQATMAAALLSGRSVLGMKGKPILGDFPSAVTRITATTSGTTTMDP